MKPKLTWLLAPISLGAFLATWGGWAKLATMTGYGKVEMLGGQAWSQFNIGIVLPMTVEPFGALAMAVAFNVKVRVWARIIAGIMAVSSLVMAAICQAVVHNLTVQGKTAAPDFVVTVTSVLPVIVLGLGAGLAMLNSARIEDDRTSHGTAGTGFMGRIGRSLGDAVASQAERLAAASQASRDADPETVLDVPGTPEVVSQELVPAVPIPVSPAVPRSPQVDVPAAQNGFKDLPVEEQERLVGERKARPDNPSYEKVGRELGISKSEAHRLGTAYSKRLKPDPVIVRDESSRDGWEHPWERKLADERARDELMTMDGVGR